MFRFCLPKQESSFHERECTNCANYNKDIGSRLVRRHSKAAVGHPKYFEVGQSSLEVFRKPPKGKPKGNWTFSNSEHSRRTKEIAEDHPMLAEDFRTFFDVLRIFSEM